MSQSDSSWSQQFTPISDQASGDFVNLADSTGWILRVITILLSFSLFIIAANKCRQGDYFACFLSFSGAILVALAPQLARKFL